MNAVSARSLPWLALGREVRPGALVLAVNTCYSAGAALLGIPGQRGSLLTDTWATVSGTVGVVAATALIVAWWARSLKVMSLGLQLAALYWLFLAVLVSQVQVPWSVSAVGAWCWAGLALMLWRRDREESFDATQ